MNILYWFLPNLFGFIPNLTVSETRLLPERPVRFYCMEPSCLNCDSGPGEEGRHSAARLEESAPTTSVHCWGREVRELTVGLKLVHISLFPPLHPCGNVNFEEKKWVLAFLDSGVPAPSAGAGEIYLQLFSCPSQAPRGWVNVSLWPGVAKVIAEIVLCELWLRMSAPSWENWKKFTCAILPTAF